MYEELHKPLTHFVLVSVMQSYSFMENNENSPIFLHSMQQYNILLVML